MAISENFSDHLNDLETRLAGTLKPVAPSNEFVHHLRDRIRLPEPGQIASRLRDWHLVLIAVGSVMSVTVIITIIARTLYYFFGPKHEGQA
jgi:hypothetical protein